MWASKPWTTISKAKLRLWFNLTFGSETYHGYAPMFLKCVVAHLNQGNRLVSEHSPMKKDKQDDPGRHGRDKSWDAVNVHAAKMQDPWRCLKVNIHNALHWKRFVNWDLSTRTDTFQGVNPLVTSTPEGLQCQMLRDAVELLQFVSHPGVRYCKVKVELCF